MPYSETRKESDMYLHILPFITLALGYGLGWYARKRTSQLDQCDERHTDNQE